METDSMILDEIKKFHGHLGPYLVIGYRMGMLANEKLGDDPFAKKAVSFTGTKPPVSCLIDGVQLSSGCTLGKGNISVMDMGEPRVIFTDKEETKLMKISLKPDISARISSEAREENMEAFSKMICALGDDDLFTVAYLESD